MVRRAKQFFIIILFVLGFVVYAASIHQSVPEAMHTLFFSYLGTMWTVITGHLSFHSPVKLK